MNIHVISNNPFHVSIYLKERYYGGPEEGGWYGTDLTLESSVQVQSKRLADELAAKLSSTADQKTKFAKTAWSKMCQRELDAAEASLIDPLDLPEPNLPDEYCVFVERVKGFHATRGSRHYE